VAGAHHVLLVPGFFGFAQLGEFKYFGHVRDFLVETLPKIGFRCEVDVVHTIPTASLERRAALLAQTAAKLLKAKGTGSLSLIGHSSGGLDARLFASPGAQLPTSVDVEGLASTLRAIVTVATPHFGTPVAHFFSSLFGQQLLKLLSLSTIYALRAGRLPISAVLRLAGVFRKREAPASVLDQLWAQLLHDFSADRRRPIEEFFTKVGSDRDLLGQITPSGTAVFNASTANRPGVRYGCVVTRARRPGVRSFLRAGIDPYAHATHSLFVALYRLASRTRANQVHVPTDLIGALSRAYQSRVDTRANDGMVPTLSQVWGEVIRVAWADHHDIIGHFDHPTHVPPHFDWVASGTGFDREHFESIWRDVAAFVAAA
jgi:triacylglycerol esterase/lipase EstA (alpha/beta hydrolase family)